MIQLYKKAIHWIFYPGFAYLFERQTSFNALVLQSIADLQKRSDSTEKTLERLNFRIQELELQLQQNSDKVAAVEKNFLEQNHWRYMETRALQKDFLEQNYARIEDFKDLKQTCLSEIHATRQELIDIKFVQAHLRCSLDSLAEKQERLVSSNESLIQT